MTQGEVSEAAGSDRTGAGGSSAAASTGNSFQLGQQQQRQKSPPPFLVNGVEPEAKGGCACPFPWRLHVMLEATEKEGLQDVVSWRPHGRAFIVHRVSDFVDKVLTRFFTQSKYSSFQRQLNMYGFTRFQSGRDKGSYYHRCFVRGEPRLVRGMVRRKIKGALSRRNLAPMQEPNFYDPAGGSEQKKGLGNQSCGSPGVVSDHDELTSLSSSFAAPSSATSSPRPPPGAVRALGPPPASGVSSSSKNAAQAAAASCLPSLVVCGNHNVPSLFLRQAASINGGCGVSSSQRSDQFLGFRQQKKEFLSPAAFNGGFMRLPDDSGNNDAFPSDALATVAANSFMMNELFVDCKHDVAMGGRGQQPWLTMQDIVVDINSVPVASELCFETFADPKEDKIPEPIGAVSSSSRAAAGNTTTSLLELQLGQQQLLHFNQEKHHRFLLPSSIHHSTPRAL